MAGPHRENQRRQARRGNHDFGRMRIAVVQDYLRMGGTERQSVLLANAYAAAGHDTHLVTFRPGGALAGEIAPDVRHVCLQHHDRGIDWWAPGLTKTIVRLRPEIVQLMGRAVQILGWRLPRALPSTRFVATFRTGKPVPWLHRVTLRRAHAIVANSEEARTRLAAAYGLAGSRVRVIRNAVAAPAPPPPDARAEVRRTLGTKPDVVVFLCTAMMRPEKGHRELLHIAATLDLDLPWELWLAGEGTEFSACRRLAADLQLGSRVRFLGLRHDVTQLYAAADVAVLASRRESLPNFLVEAQWLGLPVVAMDVAGVGETFAPGRSGILVPPGNAHEFRAALIGLAHDPQQRRRMSEAARRHAAAEFAPSRQNEKYLALFAELTASPPAIPR